MDLIRLQKGALHGCKKALIRAEYGFNKASKRGLHRGLGV